jgi:O-antigen ligase
MIGAILLVIAIIFSTGEKLDVLKPNITFIIFFSVTAILIFLSGFDHYIGEGIRPFAIVLLLLFPVFYFVWSNRNDYRLLFTLIALAMAIAGLIFLFLCLVIAPPVLGVRYLGMTPNPNALGTIMASVFTCGVFLLFKNKKPLFVFGLFTLLLSAIMLILSDSRTSLLIVFVILVFSVIRMFQSFFRDKKRSLQIRFRIIIVIGIVCIAGFLFLFSQSNEGDGKSGIGSSRIGRNIELLFSDNDRFKVADRILSGRLAIWDTYIGLIDFRGHDSHELPYSNAKGKRLAAHNNVIDIAYRIGLSAGIAYAGLLFLSLLYAIKYFFRKEKLRYAALFVGMFVLNYFITMMFETMLTMTLYPVVFIFYLCIGPLFFADGDKAV